MEKLLWHVVGRIVTGAAGGAAVLLLVALIVLGGCVARVGQAKGELTDAEIRLLCGSSSSSLLLPRLCQDSSADPR